jgi:superfamily II DNA or RNA helicase
MNLTDYHAKYFAYELTKRSPSDSVETFAGVLADAQVDLNPHQIEAALFAFRNPFSRGAILADEVGLGKTIEAGLLLSQRWAERKRKLLIIVPANLRKQWSQELSDKFHLPSIILENRSFNESIRNGNLNPFVQSSIVLCSYQFVRSKEPYLRQIAWDLVVIDEAHRLRNVYKTSSRIALAIKNAVAAFPKVLLTATPLQNSLLELYGLVSIIDEYTFGDLKSFRARFARLGNQSDFTELKERLKPVCKRTLRRQVLEYISYTDRHALVQEFVPSADEQKLYDLVSEYLQRPTLYALPAGQRQLMTLILRKLLSSSTYAISGTLDGLAKKLEGAAAAAEAVTSPPDELPDNLEDFDELADEWEEDGDPPPAEKPGLTPEQLTQLRAELEQLREFKRLATSIVKNSKGEVLLTALRRGFAAAAKAQGKQGGVTLQQKAVVFTESRRTQDYLFRVLEQTEFKGKVMIFNGVNNDPGSKAIYQKWVAKHAGTDRVSGSPTADLRAALVDHFRDEASILIATEAAAEGINLQFCNLVVNYDLPWNPQRIEQRIGRCHRYGQKFDVVVVNFLNKTNAADQRVYQLLDQKFRLFNGVFGASDEVLGAVESGVDFEKRIAAIYQQCRSPEQIEFEFDQLQKELETDIAEGQQDAREKLLDNFDQEVVEKVRIQSHNVLDRFNRQLWLMTRHVLADHARFDDSNYSFMLHDNPFSGETIHPGPYRIGKKIDDVNTYRVGHPLAQRVLDRAKAASTPVNQLAFHLTGSGKNIAILVPFIGRQGWLCCTRLSVKALEVEDHLLFSAIDDSGEVLDDAQCQRFFDLLASDEGVVEFPSSMAAKINAIKASERRATLEEIGTRNGHWFDVEIEKLEHWAEDRRATLKGELEELDEALKLARKSARTAPTLPEKLERQREVRKLEGRRDDAWRAFDQATRDLEKKKDSLLDEIAKRLEQNVEEEILFTLRWRIV